MRIKNGGFLNLVIKRIMIKMILTTNIINFDLMKFNKKFL